MKNKSVYFATGCILAAGLLFSGSCNKIRIDEERAILQNGNADLRQCALREISSPGDNFNLTHRDFVYNVHGDPVSATPEQIGTGSPQWLFFYDGKERLIEYLGAYSPGNQFFEFMHKYKYDGQNRIISDSLYTLGAYDNLSISIEQFNTTYVYDRLNRIVQETIAGNRPFFTPPETFEFAELYKRIGNLLKVGSPALYSYISPELQ